MTVFIQFGLLGIGIGAAVGLSAIGLIVVYRSSGVLNFAGGSVGAVAAFVYYDMKESNFSTPVALILALLLGAAIGGVSQVLIMRQLHRASAVTKLIASLALFSALQGLVIVHWGSTGQFVSSLLPERRISFGHGIGVPEDRIWLFGIALVIGTVLWAIYRFTIFGLATSAVAENRRAASALGWSSNLIEFINWALSGALSALTAILLAPIVGLDISALALLVIPALAAALVGGFSSFPLTLGISVLLGIIQSEFERYVHVTGAAQSVPFIVIAIVIMLGGRSRPARQDLPGRLPLPGTGHITKTVVIVGFVLLVALIQSSDPEWTDAITLTLVMAMMVLSIVALTGFGGQLSLSQWAIAGLGAMMAARLVGSAGLPFWLSFVIAVVAIVPIGMILALPALRTRGVNLGIVTLGLAAAIQALILNNSWFTGGTYGTAVPAPHLFGIDLDPIVHSNRYALMALVLFVLLGLGVANLRRGRTGRRLLAVRSNERVAASLGIKVQGVKIYAFAFAAFVAAVAGIVNGFRTPNVSFEGYDPITNINVVVYAVIGGVGWVSGALAGAMLEPGSYVAHAVDKWVHIANWLPVIAGGILLITLFQAPEGVAKLNGEAIHAFRDFILRKIGRPRSNRSKIAASADRGERAPMKEVADLVPEDLEINGVTVRYGPVVALEDVTLTARPGQVTGLIGPNGAGKTSLLDAISGFAAASSGSISIGGRRIDRWSVEKRARSGLARTFQAVELFHEMSVVENLLVAGESPSGSMYVTDLVKPGQAKLTDLMYEVIDEFDLMDKLDDRPGSLPHGTARLVGIARSLVSDSRVLLLDEPAAGLDLRERSELGHIIRRIANERQVAVLLVEHDVDLVMRTCDHIVVLDFGKVIATGTPDEISRNPAVIAAYLGGEPEVVEESESAPSAATATS
jgi:sulfate-transporting ATPase